MRRLKYLFRPIRIEAMEVKNRIVMSPMGTNLASPDGEVTQSLIDFLTARARGGAGLIITEDTTIGPQYIWHTLSLHEDRFIPGWHKLARAVHAHGAKIAPQLIHPSFNSRSALSGVQPVAASPIPSRFYRELPRELTVEEIEKIIEQFGEAARRAREAGCDAVQIHCAHCHHLLGSFISALYNKRADAYGGTIEGRMRLPLEVIRRIRSKAGAKFPILIRISGAELEPGGRTMEETRYLTPLLAEAGVDAIHISAGTTNRPWTTTPPMGSPLGINASLAAGVKDVVDVPVICVGRINSPWIAENILASERADMVAMGRALLADPEFPSKAARGAWEEIAPCVGDSFCLVSVLTDKKISCLTNASVGREEEMTLVPAKTRKKILVAGGGPAGLETARIAALRGHEVTLMEKTSKLGGQLLIASFPPMKQELTHLVQYLAAQVYEAGARVELNQEVTPEFLERLRPDAVIIATGGVPLIPADIPVVTDKNVVTAWDVLAGHVMVGPQVLVIGGGTVGCETADFIVHPVDDRKPGANQVTIIEMLENVALDELSSSRSLLIERLRTKGVRIITEAKVVQILADGVQYCKNGREEMLLGMDTIVLAVGTKSDNVLCERLKGSSIPTFVIGDAKEPRKAVEAIAEGWEIARRI